MANQKDGTEDPNTVKKNITFFLNRFRVAPNIVPPNNPPTMIFNNPNKVKVIVTLLAAHNLGNIGSPVI